LVLLAAAGLKFHQQTHTPPQLRQGWLESMPLIIPLAGCELVLGALLISGIWDGIARKVAIVAFSAFAVIAIAEGIARQRSCGCFGAVQISPWYTATFDICAVATLLLCKPPLNMTQRHPSLARIAFAAAILTAGVATATVWEIRRPAVVTTELSTAGEADPFAAPDSLVVLEPSGWAGKPFTLASHIDVRSKLDSGHWIVMLVHHDCDHCIAAVPKYETFAATHPDSKLAIVELPPYAQPGEELPITADVSLIGKLDTSRDWFATTPVAIYLTDGIVQAAADGDKAETPDPSWK
jgi:hypothetical protein